MTNSNVELPTSNVQLPTSGSVEAFAHGLTALDTILAEVEGKPLTNENRHKFYYALSAVRFHCDPMSAEYQRVDRIISALLVRAERVVGIQQESFRASTIEK